MRNLNTVKFLSLFPYFYTGILLLILPSLLLAGGNQSVDVNDHRRRGIRPGIEIGVSYVYLDFVHIHLDKGNFSGRYAPNIMAYAEFSVKPHIILRSGMRYTESGVRWNVKKTLTDSNGILVDSSTVIVTDRLHYLTLPLRLQRQVFGDLAYLITGVEAGVLISARSSMQRHQQDSLIKVGDFTSLLNRLNFVVCIGIGTTYNTGQHKIQLQTQFFFGLAGTTKKYSSSSNSRTQEIAISLGYIL